MCSKLLHLRGWFSYFSKQLPLLLCLRSHQHMYYFHFNVQARATLFSIWEKRWRIWKIIFDGYYYGYSMVSYNTLCGWLTISFSLGDHYIIVWYTHWSITPTSGTSEETDIKILCMHVLNIIIYVFYVYISPCTYILINVYNECMNAC
jgi:hypothetical protein